jgi:hypothetical protein
VSLNYLLPLDESGLLVPASDLALHLRSSDLNVYGPLRGTPTFARASEGLMRDSQGVQFLAAYGQPRVEYFDLDGDAVYETPALCFDGARTTLQARGADWSFATLSNLTRTAGAARCGDMLFDKLNDADGVNAGTATLPNLSATLAANGNGVALITFCAPDVAAASGHSIVLFDTTATASRGGVTVTWTAGVATVVALGGATLLWSRQIGVTLDGRRVYEAAFKPTGTLSTNNHAVRVTPAVTGAQTGDCYIGYAHVEDVTTFPLPMVVHPGTGSAAYVAETWSLPFGAPPQAMTFYLDFIEAGTRYSAAGVRLLSLGNSTPGTPELKLETDGAGAYRLTHHNGTSPVSAAAGASGGSAIPNVGQRVQLYATMSATGAVSIQQSIAGAAWSPVVTSGALALAAAWATPTALHLGHSYTNRQALRLIEVKVGIGALGLARMVGA